MKVLQGEELFFDSTRLQIMIILYLQTAQNFSELKNYLNMISDGNLAFHLKKLSDKSYIQQKKSYITKPETSYSLTSAGKSAIKKHLQYLKNIIAEIG